MRVLVVEDELLIRWSIAETLKAAGHSVVEAADAAAARRALDDAQSDPVNVVLLDFRLPDSNDLGLLADIRKRTPDSAVVMMTAYGTSEVTQGAAALGVHRVIDKPFDLHALEPILAEAYAAR